MIYSKLAWCTLPGLMETMLCKVFTPDVRACGCRDLAELNSSVLDDVVLSPHWAGSTPRCRIDMEGQIRASQVFKASQVSFSSPSQARLKHSVQ
jgi:hypothetical protein